MKIEVSPIDKEEGCLTSSEVWSYMITGEYLVDVAVPVILVILIQFPECGF